MKTSTAASKKLTRHYGDWPSAISTDLITSDSITLDEVKLTSKSIYYIERRPQETGRCALVKVTKNKAIDLLPAPFSVRSRVNEYGGGGYCVDDDLIFFINDSDQDIYSINNKQISRITNSENQRFADFNFDRNKQQLIAICETHHEHQTTHSIVSIDVSNGKISTLEEGNDFYASPRLNHATDQLCWQTWNHPNMPWDGNQLWLAEIDNNGKLINKKQIAGADDVSVFQPQWSPDDTLYFISDDTGWWHLYRHLDNSSADSNEQLTSGEKEFGLPQWVFAQSSYAFIDDKQLICCYQSCGKTVLATLSLSGKAKLTVLDTPWHAFSSISALDGRVSFIAASSQSFPQLVYATIGVNSPRLLSSTVIKTSCQLHLSEEHYSIAQTITFTNRHQQKVYANYYPPTNPGYQAEAEAKPPMIVICHGGPTGQSSTALDAKKQFWTSRGFALLDVNYSGSTGYGKKYRTRLNYQWGVLDVEDCCDAALHAAEQGLASKDQLIIRGSSAGGYTVLSALTFSNVFSAGASYYGISELTSLASDTHKFESRYFDRLIGPYPETKKLYRQRSPINSVEKLNCPVIFFQGVEDRVVPKDQAEKMFFAIKKKGVSVAAQYFPGEQHGFRKAETIKQSLENELSFYKIVFILKPADETSFIGDIQLANILRTTN